MYNISGFFHIFFEQSDMFARNVMSTVNPPPPSYSFNVNANNMIVSSVRFAKSPTIVIFYTSYESVCSFDLCHNVTDVERYKRLISECEKSIFAFV